MAEVSAHVYVMVDGQPVLLTPGDTVPDGVEVTNPAALAEAPEAEDEDADKSAPAKKAPARKAHADS